MNTVISTSTNYNIAIQAPALREGFTKTNKMKIEEALIRFIQQQVINKAELARIVGMPEPSLKNTFLMERGIPRKHFFNLLAECVRLGFKLREGTHIQVLKTDAIIYIQDLELEEVDMGTYFLYKQHQVRDLIDDEIFDKEF